MDFLRLRPPRLGRGHWRRATPWMRPGEGLHHRLQAEASHAQNERSKLLGARSANLQQRLFPLLLMQLRHNRKLFSQLQQCALILSAISLTGNARHNFPHPPESPLETQLTPLRPSFPADTKSPNPNAPSARLLSIAIAFFKVAIAASDCAALISTSPKYAHRLRLFRIVLQFFRKLVRRLLVALLFPIQIPQSKMHIRLPRSVLAASSNSLIASSEMVLRILRLAHQHMHCR